MEDDSVDEQEAREDLKGEGEILRGTAKDEKNEEKDQNDPNQSKENVNEKDK